MLSVEAQIFQWKFSIGKQLAEAFCRCAGSMCVGWCEDRCVQIALVQFSVYNFLGSMCADRCVRTAVESTVWIQIDAHKIGMCKSRDHWSLDSKSGIKFPIEEHPFENSFVLHTSGGFAKLRKWLPLLIEFRNESYVTKIFASFWDPRTERFSSCLKYNAVGARSSYLGSYFQNYILESIRTSYLGFLKFSNQLNELNEWN